VLPAGSSCVRKPAMAADSLPFDPPGVRLRFQGLFALLVIRLSASVE
jgi:hypothetical protein